MREMAARPPTWRPCETRATHSLHSVSTPFAVHIRKPHYTPALATHVWGYASRTRRACGCKRSMAVAPSLLGLFKSSSLLLHLLGHCVQGHIMRIDGPVQG